MSSDINPNIHQIDAAKLPVMLSNGCTSSP